ncbi:MAG: phospholipase [Ruminococcaceae bacterium]|nr:phospholipase [Oscillospiraceae bacterium]
MKKGICALLTVLLLTPLCGLFPLKASAEAVVPDMTEIFEKKQFTTEGGYVLNYSIHLPEDYDPAVKYPVVLFMHGAGERGSDLEKHLKTGIIESFKKTESPLYDCIVVAPQCPEGKQWVNVAKWTDCIYSTEDIAESQELAAVVELVLSLKELYSTNTNRYYVTGLSMGGYATWDLLVRHPEIFAAAMPLCGGADRDNAAVIKDIPVWAFHGMKDPTVPYTGTKQICTRMKQLGGKNVTFTEYPDHQHNIWSDVYAREDIWTWLLAQDLSDRFPELKVTEPVTDAPTEAPTEEPIMPTQSAGTAQAPAEERGCGATVGSAIAVTALTGGLLLKKKKED